MYLFRHEHVWYNPTDNELEVFGDLAVLCSLRILTDNWIYIGEL